MKKQYEIAVIGGGPAGGMAAWKAAGMGALTILLERDREIGIPVRCGEMATLDVFERYFPITEKLIANPWSDPVFPKTGI
jgi:digeranylgeranylglycerophospholipid reductase